MHSSITGSQELHKNTPYINIHVINKKSVRLKGNTYISYENLKSSFLYNIFVENKFSGPLVDNFGVKRLHFKPSQNLKDNFDKLNYLQ